MKLEFKNCLGEIRLLKEVSSKEEAMESIKEFCSHRNFEIEYMRSWTKNGVTTVDVGSYTEFFYISE